MRSFFLWLKKEIHMYSWVALITLDLVWTVGEVGSALSFLGILLLPIWMIMIFLVCFAAVLSIQRFVTGDDWQPALTKGLILGLLAAVPFSFFSVILGGAVGLFDLFAGKTFTHQFGQIGIHYRELETILRHAALSAGMPRGGFPLRLEQTVDYLAGVGRISRSEAAELRHLRAAWSNVHHNEFSTNLTPLMNLSAQLLNRYRSRFSQP